MQIRTTRRELIGGAAAALAGFQTAAAATTPATHSEDLKLGVASYSFRKFSRADAIKGIKALNVQYVNIKDFHLALKSTPEEIAAARKDFEDAGFKPEVMPGILKGNAVRLLGLDTTTPA